MILDKSPKAVRYCEAMFARQKQMALGNAYGYVSDVMARNIMEDDAGEGVDAFIEKRSLQWRV